MLVSVKPGKGKKIFLCRLFDIFSLLSGMTLTSRENIWYLVMIIGLESCNDYLVPDIFSPLVSVKPDKGEKIFVCHVLDNGNR